MDRRTNNQFRQVASLLIGGLTTLAVAYSPARFDDFYFSPHAEEEAGTVTELSWELVDGLPVAHKNGACATYSNELYYLGPDGTNAYKFDGSSWSAIPGPDGPFSGTVACEHDGKLWLLGSWGGSGMCAAWNGTAWCSTNNAGNVNYPAFGEVTGMLFSAGGGRTDIYGFNETNFVDTGDDFATVGNYTGGFAMSNKLYYVVGYTAGYATNVYCYDGASVSEVNGLPHAQCWGYPDAVGGSGYWVGGSDGSLQTNVFRFNGEDWSYETGLPMAIQQGTVGHLGDYLYFVGGDSGGTLTNVYRTKWIGAPE